ncbi:MAG: S-adenosylmethionine:tRNA ribosyltransferase-isomerase [Lewinellaceae bacterium]|nr:S-adenosylmethionine:tRNA ribosyltransferase-isomerase [Lewinellaceae bacterium]
MAQTNAVPTSPRDIRIEEYAYELPEARIALFPLEQRDASKLLLYQGGSLGQAQFRELPQHLPPGTLLLFNDTRVIHARLRFELPGGAPLEILCLEPLAPAEYQQNFSQYGPVRWKCLVGGNRKWKTGKIEKQIAAPEGTIRLTATRLARVEDAFDISFEWDQPAISFGELLALGGIIPLPPYLRRENVPSDEERYQTIYARSQGSVAAPTAGLHFTDAVFKALDAKGIGRAFATLHVGAGTFKPVKAETMEGHHMHEESFFIRRKTLEALAGALEAGKPIIPVGTTSLRVLESLYWCGASIGRQGAAAAHSSLHVAQWEPYEQPTSLPAAQALHILLDAMNTQHTEALEGHTQLIIAPGYRFRLANGLITNFHQPHSTLLLLIAALVGDDWRRIYQYALDNGFRFLSYGDSSLLLP